MFLLMNTTQNQNVKRFSKMQLIKRAEQSEKDIRNNKVTSLKKLKQEIKNW